MNQKNLNLGILVSGNGSNLQAIIDACEKNLLPAKVAVVISDNSEAFAIKRAKKHGIPSEFIDRHKYLSRKLFEERIISILNEHGVNLVCLAGFMRIIGETLLRAFPMNIINIHPALLPSFVGLDAQKQAFEHGVKYTGCTVHFVDEKTDHGPIICQAVVEVKEDDTLETLRERILGEEHKIYPKAIKLIAEKKITMVGRKVKVVRA